MFPFLIGRIRTEQSLGLEDILVLFPFLIGRIRTFNRQGAREESPFVSIPHR